MPVTYRGETFPGYNDPKRTPDDPDKSHAVLVKQGGVIRLLRFGLQGAKGSPKKKGESKAWKKRREAWYARHRKNIMKGPLSPAWWAAKVKW